ncbi:TolC family protein [Phenylobacterium sp.]|uniref:TolC family protein n=1 Tax=Phenylobacterium sp. TaxID=1871053 RepID=UPI0025E01E17|nr:TolC family protein [Phenylobacterium sp.]
MTLRRLVFMVAAGCAVASPVSAEPGLQRPPFLPPDSLIRTALDEDPSVGEAEARLAAARAEARQLAVGEHETTLIAGFDDRRVRGEGRYGEWTAQLSRGLRLPGKAALDRTAGRFGEKAASDGVEDARHHASLELAARWIAWAEAAERTEIDAAEVEAYRAEVRALERRVELKDAALLDLQVAQGALARARAAHQQSVSAERRAALELRNLHPGLAPERSPALTPPQPPERPFAAWPELIVARSHELTMARADADREQALARRARLDRVADPSLGIRTFNERGGDETGVGIFVSIPFGGPRRSAIADRQVAAASGAEARYRMMERTIRMTAQTDTAAAETALAAWREAESARLASGTAAERIARAYALGERDLADRLAAERQAFEARRFELAARAEAQRTLLKMALDAHELWLSEE